MPSDVYLLGSGIRGTLQVTRETEQALSVCARVYVLHADAAILDYASKFCGDVRDVAHLYEGQVVRRDVYEAIADLLVGDVRSGTRPVGFLVHGHPLFLVSAAEYTLEQARAAGLQAVALPAVSSFDTILCDLEIDYGYALQMFDSTTLLELQAPLNPRVPLLIFQLATTLNPSVVRVDPGAQLLEPLAAFLRGTYPATHPCQIVYSSAQVFESSELLTIRLEELPTSSLVELWRRPTLYVPPIG